MAEMEIKRNERVMAVDGTEVGHVTHVIVDGPSHQVTDIVVHHDGHDMLIPLSNVERGSSNELMLRATASQVAGATPFTRDGYHEVDVNEIENTPARSMPGTNVVEHADRNSVVVGEIPVTTSRTTETTARVPQPVARQTTETTARTAASQPVRAGEEITVPVVEEQLRAGVRERAAGSFHLRKDVITEQQSIDVPVQREEAYITERTVAERSATQADLAAMDQDISVPLRKQEVVTSKEAIVTGEVGIRKETVTETQRVSDTVRREEVHVEGTNSDRIHTEGFTTEQRTRHAAMSPVDQARYGRFTEAERTEYDALPVERRQAWVTDYDRRNPIQKAADKITSR